MRRPSSTPSAARAAHEGAHGAPGEEPEGAHGAPDEDPVRTPVPNRAKGGVRGLAARVGEQNPLPPGAVVVGIGLGLSGLATYAYFAVASRALDAESYAAVGVLWSLLFAVGNGVMQPLEQEVARAVAHRRALGIGPGPVIRRAVAIGAAFSAGLVLLSLAIEELAVLGVWPEALTLSQLLDGDPVLVAAFLVGLVGFGVGHLARGSLSSHGRFRAYAAFFAVDGTSRVALAAVLGVVGVATAGPFGVTLAIAPFLGAGVAVLGRRGLLEPGPEAAWGELTRALGWLLAGTVSLALVVQGGTIAVDVLATDDQSEAAGVFLNGLVIARIPLFLFQAVLASLLPRLSRLAGLRDLSAFERTLTRLVAAILLAGVVTTLAAVAVGPAVVDALFGSDAVLGARDLGLLAGTFVLIMVAICLDQALIALNGHNLMATGWMLALGVFVAVTAVASEDLFLRVELGLLAASITAAAWMAAWLAVRVRQHPEVEPVTLAEAAAETPLQD